MEQVADEQMEQVNSESEALASEPSAEELVISMKFFRPLTHRRRRSFDNLIICAYLQQSFEKYWQVARKLRKSSVKWQSRTEPFESRLRRVGSVLHDLRALHVHNAQLPSDHQ